jgi:hypothetical protein
LFPGREVLPGDGARVEADGGQGLDVHVRLLVQPLDGFGAGTAIVAAAAGFADPDSGDGSGICNRRSIHICCVIFATVCRLRQVFFVDPSRRPTATAKAKNQPLATGALFPRKCISSRVLGFFLCIYH